MTDEIKKIINDVQVHMEKAINHLETELAKYLHPEELRYILNTKSPSTQIMSLQSKGLKEERHNHRVLSSDTI